MEPKEPLGPPELPTKGKPAAKTEAAPHIQLVKSTKAMVPPPEPAPVDDEPDELNELVEHPGDPDGVHAAEQERVWRQTHDGTDYTPTAPAKRKRRWPIIVLVLILVAAAAGGAYWFGSHKAKQPANGGTTHQAPIKPGPTPTTATKTKHYDSVTYTLGFDYPENWVVNDTTSKLTVTSPTTQLTGADGSAHSTHVVVTIQNQQTTVPGYPSDGAVAALDSDHLTYKQPTAVQRAQTYLSFLSYHQQNSLDQLFITGDNGYQQGQNVPLSDIVKGNPLVSVSFETCSTDDCSGTPTPTTLQASTWKSAAASKQVTDLLQSMQLN